MIVLISLVRFFFSVECSAVGQTVGNMSKSAEVMKLVNNLMKAPQMAATMQKFTKEMTKVALSVSLSLTQLKAL